jgi:dTDP-glucose pyrophosphorylase
MERMTSTHYVFQIVVDDVGHVAGTVTDGDIRRALLRGGNLGDHIGECMMRAPLTGTLGNDSENRQRLEQVIQRRTHLGFLPVTDGHRQLTQILIANELPKVGCSALVMAGGKGTRLGSHTRHIPKPLVKVAGRPLLEHVLCRLESGPVDKVYISVHHFAEQIEDYVAARKNLCEVEFIYEPEPRGTAGALGLLPGPVNSPLLVLNGDVLTEFDTTNLLDFHRSYGFDATLSVAQHEIDVPFGVVKHDDDGLFKGIDEKPRLQQLIAAGIYLLSHDFLSLVPRGRPVDMPELLNIGRGFGMKIGLFPIHEYWVDVGRPDDLAAADARHRDSG